MDYYQVRNWQRFQHYKDRNPPWIKLHYEILTSADWVMLADTSKLLAVVCMMVASRNEGKVPADPNYLKRVAYLEKIPDLKPLIKCGFLINPLAECIISKQPQVDAIPETETYSTEAERERDSPPAVMAVRTTVMPYIDIPHEWKAHAMREKGWPENVVLDIWQGFYEYWRNGKGKSTKREDWSASWRTWYRKENIKSTGGNYATQSKFNLALEATERARLKREQRDTGEAR